jgi:CRISPR-associated protein Cas2
MWVMVMFDLPTNTKHERIAASRFRNDLKDLGFEMVQYSVYIRFCASQSKAETAITSIQWIIPTPGLVSILLFTDKQYENIRTFTGGQRTAQKTPPGQLEMF